MSFDRAWLDLREPADHAARDATLLDAAKNFLLATDDPVGVDLGAGTGSTVRAFGPMAGVRWRLVDGDAGLLALARARLGACVETVEADLARFDALPFNDVRLVTASALLDLAGIDWVRRVADTITGHRAAFYAALSYDGRMEWTLPDPDDEAVTRAFNRHQTGDKGLGPALGPKATVALAAEFAARGYSVRTAESPWRLGSKDHALQERLIGGIASAAGEAGFAASSEWARRRIAGIPSGACLIGHRDLLALPPG